MALASCRECGSQVSSSAKTCPHCGLARPTENEVTAAFTKWARVILTVMAAGFAIYATTVVSQCSANIEQTIRGK